MEFQAVVYEHAAALIGARPWDAARDAGLLARAHMAAYARYRHRPVVPGIDIYNLEAEAYGAAVTEPPGDAIPAIATHPCAGVDEIAAMPHPDPAAGRLGLVATAARRIAEEAPDAAVRLPLSGPFSIAAGLVGCENLLMALCTEPAMVTAALEHLVAGQLARCRAIAAAGFGVAVFESAATPPLVPPALFATLLRPPLTALVRGCAELVDEPIACVIGGDTAPIAEDLVATGAGFVICPGETDRAAFLARLARHPAVAVRVNLDPAGFADPDPGPALAEAEQVLAVVGDRPRTCIGTGVLPYDAVPATVDAVRARVEKGA